MTPSTEALGISHRLNEVRTRIAQAEVASGRPPGSTRLVAVSKRQPSALIRAAYASGQRDFGENYVQELATKRQELSDLPDLRWHLLGNVQLNKARVVMTCAQILHTVDDPFLVRELDRRKGTRVEPLAVLIQVNMAGEVQKYGCAPGDLAAVLDAVEAVPSLRLVGLMALPPQSDDPAASRPYFSTLRTLRNLHGGVDRLPELSMGMSHDFEVAIAEGATLVRVGTAIFGARS